MTPLGRVSWKLAPVFLLTLLHMPFPFVIFYLYSFTVINISHEYNYMMNPLGPPRKISEPGGGLENTGQRNQEVHLFSRVENNQTGQHIKEFHSMVINPI